MTQYYSYILFSFLPRLPSANSIRRKKKVVECSLTCIGYYSKQNHHIIHKVPASYIYIYAHPPYDTQNEHFAHLSITVIRQPLRKSKNPKTKKSKNPKIQNFLHLQNLAFFWILDFWILDFWIFGFLDCWIFWIFGFLDFWIVGFFLCFLDM